MALPHRRRSTVIAASILLALPVSTSAATAAAAAPAPAAPPVPAPDASLAATPVPPADRPADGSTHRITLVTGDVVTFTEAADPGDQPFIAVEKMARPGGVPVDIVTEHSGGAYYVIPSDALPYVESAVVDPALFDVRGLIEQGLTDAATDALPVIVEYAAGSRAASALPVEDLTALPVVGGAAASVPHDEASAFWAAVAAPAQDSRAARGAAQVALGAGVSAVHLDRRVQLSLDTSVGQVGAPTAWEAGYDGTGVSVAVLDSGVDATHPDLAGQVTEARSFVDGETDPTDFAGHGTHVAATIAGTGAASDGRYRGVAPGASLLNGKVCNQYGQCALSWILAGMDWAAHSGAAVVNMSLGGEPTDGTDLMAETLDSLSAETGTLFVVAAGNDYDDLTVSTPGTADAALTVGAVDDSDAVTDFSSKGPRLGDGGVKPEISAPGAGIVAARATNGFPDVPAEVQYVGLSGTSMATPHVAGAAAIVAQAHPGATATELKDVLVSTSVDVGAPWYHQGAGRLDIPAALSGLDGVSAPAAISMGTIAHDAGATAATLTYTNHGSTDVTVTPAYAPTGWDGHDGTAALSASTLTVPAAGTATLTVTVDPAVGEPGLYGGVVTATGADGVELRTPVSWYTPYPPAPKHRLTIGIVGSDGAPVAADQVPFGTNLFVLRDEVPSAETPNDPFAYAPSMTHAQLTQDGTWIAELPAGTYSAFYQHVETEPDRRRTSILAAVDIDLGGAASVTLDARDAVPSRADIGEATYRYDRQTEIYAQGGDAGLIMSANGAFMEDLEIFVTPSAAPQNGALKIQQNVSLGSRFVSMRALGRELSAQFDPFLVTTELTGEHSLPVVYAGAGTPAEIAAADVRGKAVLVSIPLPSTPGREGAYDAADLAVQAAVHAAAAGATVLVPYLDSPGALPTVVGWDRGPGTAVPIPIMSIGHADGEGLRAEPEAVLDLSVSANPERMYVLNFAPDDGVPADLTHEVSSRSLTAIDSRFHADVADLALFQWWWGQKLGDRMSSSTNPYLYLRAPAEIEHYVGPVRDDVRWRRTSQLTDGADGRFEQFAETLPDTRDEDWFAGPIAPASPESPLEGHAGYMRLDDDRLVSTPFLTDSTTGHYTSVDWGAYPLTHRLFRLDGDGETEIAAEGAPVPSFLMPSEPGRYRMESSFVLPETDWQGPSSLVRTMSPRVDNIWTFDSARPTGHDCARPSDQPCLVHPLLQLRYDLGADLTNSVRAGRSHQIEVAAAPATGSTGGTVEELTVSYSTDGGATWAAARTRPEGDGTFTARLKHPPVHRTDGFVWLRVTARDSAGTTVEQTVQRAYELI